MGAIYEKTSNYGLNLYGDNDPADLRDGYNDSMRILDQKIHQLEILVRESKELS